MKAKELIKLPLGKYNLTDGIYNYSMHKTLTNNHEPIYSIKERLSCDHICLFEFEEKVEFEHSLRYYKSTRLSASIAAGGISIHSDDTYFAIRHLRFKQRGSFRQFVINTN